MAPQSQFRLFRTGVLTIGANSSNQITTNAAGNMVLSTGSTSGISFSAGTGGLNYTTPLTLQNATNQLVIQPGATGNTFTVNAATPGQNTTLTVPDPGVATNYVAYSLVPVIKTVAATTNVPLTVAQSGTLIVIGATNTGAMTITLPALTAGVNFKISLAAATSTAAVQVVAPSACILGTATAASGTAADNVGLPIPAAKTYFSFTTYALVGDHAEITCDGVHYFINAVTNALTNTNPAFATS